MSDVSHLYFEEHGQSASGLTKKWQVCAQRSNVTLGEIRWYANWRSYVLYPAIGTLFDVACLQEIATFIHDQMEARR